MENYPQKMKNNSKLKIFLFSLIFNLLFLIFNLNPVQAQQISLSINPPLLELFIKPGKSVLIAYKIKNQGDPVILSSRVSPFEPADNLGNIKIKNQFKGPVRFSLDNSTIRLGKPFFLKTNQSEQLLLRIRIPPGAPEGDYYYTLLVESKPTAFEEGISSSRAKATIGSNILITVSKTGRVDLQGKIALFSLLPRLKLPFLKTLFPSINVFDSSDKIPVVLIIENKGKNLVKPQGEIVLKGNFGERAKYKIIPKNILAHSQRLIPASPSAKINCQQKTNKLCKLPTSLILSGFFIGKYSLSATINFGQGSPQLFASASFIALPLKFLLGLIISLSLALIIIQKIKKNR